MVRGKTSDMSVASNFNSQHEPVELRYINAALYEKQGHTCCYCCCDMRRATIILNIFSVIFCFAAIAGVFWASEVNEAIDEVFNLIQHDNYDDDDLQEDVHFVIENYSWTLYVFFGVSILFSIIGTVGAIAYRPRMVMICAMWYLAKGLASLVIFGYGGLGLLVAGIWAYPCIMLYQEILEGIMSEENYENEVYSCCCVPNPNKKLTIREAIEHRLGIFA